jgi:hypothetical protein
MTGVTGTGSTPAPAHQYVEVVRHNRGLPRCRSVVGLFKRPGPFVAGSICSRDRAVIKARVLVAEQFVLLDAGPVIKD